LAEERRLIESVEVTTADIHLIQLKSILDASTVDELEHVLNYLFSQGKFKLVIDLSKVEFVSSAGWGVFVGELKKIREHQGDLKLSGLQPDVLDVFLLLELDTLIETYVTAEEAIAAFLKQVPHEAGEPEAPAEAPALDEEAARAVDAVQEAQDNHPEMQDPGDEPAAAPPAEVEEVFSEEHFESSAQPQEETETNRADSAEPEKSGTEPDESRQEQALPPPEPENLDETTENIGLNRNLFEHLADYATSRQEQDILPPDIRHSKPQAESIEDALADQKNGEAEGELENPFDIAEIEDPWLGNDENLSLDSLAGIFSEAEIRSFQEYSPEQEKKDEPYFELKETENPPQGESDDKNGLEKLSEQRSSFRRIQSRRRLRSGRRKYTLAGTAKRNPEGPINRLEDDPLLEKIISVVIANPSYGPSSIRNMLIKLKLADKSLTRSMVYRKLVEIGLNTRKKRELFAKEHTP